MKCWCGETNPYFAPMPGGVCNGLGTIDCICGGDQCVCHNHGWIECDGCPECDPTEVIENDDLFCHEDLDELPRARALK